MTKTTLSVAHLRTHTQEIVDAVSAGGGAVHIISGGVAAVVLQDIRSYERLTRALSTLEALVARHAELLDGRRNDIDVVLAHMLPAHPDR